MQIRSHLLSQWEAHCKVVCLALFLLWVYSVPRCCGNCPICVHLCIKLTLSFAKASCSQCDALIYAWGCGILCPLPGNDVFELFMTAW